MSSSKTKVRHPEEKSRKGSEVWLHFTKIYKEGCKKPEGAKCNYCHNTYAWLSENGTSTLRKHVANCSKCPYNHEIKKQKTLSFQSIKEEGSENSLGLWKFEQDACRDALAQMIVKDELPFRFVEREGFRHFCSVMQPNFRKLSRITVARDCVTLFSNEKKKLRNLFMKSNQRICLTTDSWTSLQNVSYMCLTAHFIDKDWKLHKRILSFCVISSHKGEAIGRAVEACLIDWGIEKLCTLTVDNASANDVALAYLKRKFSKKSDAFILKGEFFHMRCCAHIINLIVKDGLNEIKGSVTRIRDAVKYVRSSPQREQRFKSCVEKERINHKSSLCLDVQTRWNSTFLMLNTALKFQKAFERLEDEDPHFCLELNDIPPTTKDWDDARHFTSFLEKFYDATVHLSGSLYITSTMYFTEVCAIEGFLCECAKSLDPSLSVMAMKMKSKFDKYWGKFEKVNMLLLISVVLDPRCKLRYVSFCYSELHEAATVTELTKKVREALNQIYDEYQKLEFGMCSSSNQTCVEVDQPISGASKQLMSLKSKFQKHLAQEECDGGKSEVDKYLEDACEKEGPNSHFEILNWWKVNSSRYKILSQVARDILAIPVSTVASEAAFSTGGRVIDQFRSSLTPKLVECLICLQDWLRASPLSLEVEENIADIDELEQALNVVSLNVISD
ncbi:unnamed protein product [Camellia sinensis]